MAKQHTENVYTQIDILYYRERGCLFDGEGDAGGDDGGEEEEEDGGSEGAGPGEVAECH